MIQGFSGGLLNRELIYQTDLPSFQRDFASLKTLDHGTGPSITFTRASDATYFDADGVLQTAANDTPRFDHDPATGGKSLGLLIEEERANYILQSADLGNAAWTKSNVTATANDAVAPDGNTTAAKLAATSNNGYASQPAASSIPATNGAATASVFLKRATGTGTITLELGETTTTCAVSSEWQRFSLIDSNSAVTASAVISSNVVTATRNNHNLQTGDRIRVVGGIGNLFTNFSVASITVTDANTFTFARTDPDGTGNIDYVSRTPRIKIATSGDEVWAWGGQLEIGSFITSHIPTTTAAATRAADNARVTPISSFWNQAEGTMFVEFQSQTLTQDTGSTSRRILQADDGSTAIFITQNGTNDSLQFARTGGDWNFTLGSSITSNTRAILGFAANNVNGAVNGTDGTDDTSAAIPSVTILRIGRAATNGRFQGHIRKVAYWPKRLTNTLLEQLTT